jgi:hypothetical protein
MKTILIVLAMAAGQEGDELTPARALELMKEALRQMTQAEGLLNEEKAEKAEDRERRAARALAELVEKSRGSRGRNRGGQGTDRTLRSVPKNRTGGANELKRRDGAPSKFSKPARAWGLLPPDILRAMRESAASDIPEAYGEWWKRYFETLNGPPAR